MASGFQESPAEENSRNGQDESSRGPHYSPGGGQSMLAAVAVIRWMWQRRLRQIPSRGYRKRWVGEGGGGGGGVTIASFATHLHQRPLDNPWGKMIHWEGLNVTARGCFPCHPPPASLSLTLTAERVEASLVAIDDTGSSGASSGSLLPMQMNAELGAG